jgi:hypothetical protein
MACSPPSAGELIDPFQHNLPTSSYMRRQAISVQLRINSLQDRRPSVKSNNARRLVRLSDIPESPTIVGPACEALESDGRSCKVALAKSAEDPWCHRHHQEWRDLNARWSKVHKEAEKLAVINSETAKQKVIKLRLSVDLRRQIRDRFYPYGDDIQDYIKWIAKLESDVRQLADSLLSMYVHLRP